MTFIGWLLAGALTHLHTALCPHNDVSHVHEWGWARIDHEVWS
jgi:hypothetical protein